MSESPYETTPATTASRAQPIRKQLGTLFFARAVVNVLGAIAFLYLIVEALRIQAPGYHAATATYLSLLMFVLSIPVSLFLTVRARRMSANHLISSKSDPGPQAT